MLSSSSDNNNQWLKNGVQIAGATNKTFEAVDPGSYTVRVNSGDCSTESDATTITSAEKSFSSSVIVYPNPAYSVVSVELQANVRIARIDVYTLTGLKKHTIELLSSEGRLAAAFDVKSYAPGLYVVIINSPEGTVSKKFSKR
jgi:hypothetical protein